jgi:hypothetical protein
MENNQEFVVKKLLRIIDKQTKVFIRDDFEFDHTREIGLKVQPAQGLIYPKWNGQKWVETLPHERPKMPAFQSIFSITKPKTTESTEPVVEPTTEPVVETPAEPVKETFEPITNFEYDENE